MSRDIEPVLPPHLGQHVTEWVDDLERALDQGDANPHLVLRRLLGRVYADGVSAGWLAGADDSRHGNRRDRQRAPAAANPRANTEQLLGEIVVPAPGEFDAAVEVENSLGSLFESWMATGELILRLGTNTVMAEPGESVTVEITVHKVDRR